MIICPLPLDQLIMRTGLLDAPLVKDNDLVGMADGAQAVSDDHDRLPPIELRQVLHDRPFIIRVQRVGGLIKE